MAFSFLAGCDSGTSEPVEDDNGAEVDDEAVGEDQPVVELRWGATASAEDWVIKTIERVSERVNERTDGNVTINVYPAGQLGDATTQFEMVIDGSLDMLTEGSTTRNEFGQPEVSVFLPFYFSEEEYLEVIHSDLYQSWNDKLLEEQGVRTLAGNMMRQPVQITSTVPVYTLEDFEGFRLRIVPIPTSVQAAEALGINATSVEFGEVYLSLQQGLIEGTIAPLDMHYTMGFYEVTDYLLMIDYSLTHFEIWMNEDKFQTLSPEQQQILLEECHDAGAYYMDNVEADVEVFIQEMVASGIEIIEYEPEVRDEFTQRIQQVARDLEAEGRIPEGVIDEVNELLGR